MSDPIVMPGHGIAAEGGNTIGREPGGGDGDSGGGDDPSEFDANLVNLTNLLYADQDTPAEQGTTAAGNIERAYADLQACVDASAQSDTIELAPVDYDAITVSSGQTGLVLRGMGEASNTGRPSISGITLNAAGCIVDHVLLNAAVGGTGSLFGYDCTFNAAVTLTGSGEFQGCNLQDSLTVGGDARLVQTSFTSGPVSITGDLLIDLFTLNAIRRAGATLEVGGTMTILDAPSTAPLTVTADGDNEVQVFDVLVPNCKPGDTFAVSVAPGASTPSDGQALGSAWCEVAGTCRVPVICIGTTDTASLDLVVTLFPVATPDAP